MTLGRAPAACMRRTSSSATEGLPATAAASMAQPHTCRGRVGGHVADGRVQDRLGGCRAGVGSQAPAPSGPTTQLAHFVTLTTRAANAAGKRALPSHLLVGRGPLGLQDFYHFQRPPPVAAARKGFGEGAPHLQAWGGAGRHGEETGGGGGRCIGTQAKTPSMQARKGGLTEDDSQTGMGMGLRSKSSSCPREARSGEGTASETAPRQRPARRPRWMAPAPAAACP